MERRKRESAATWDDFSARSVCQMRLNPQRGEGGRKVAYLDGDGFLARDLCPVHERVWAGSVQTCHLTLVAACNALIKWQIWQRGIPPDPDKTPLYAPSPTIGDPQTVVDVLPKSRPLTICGAKASLEMWWHYARLLTGRSSLATVSPVLIPTAGYY